MSSKQEKTPKPQILTCQWVEGEMLRLTALPFAINNIEVHFDRLANGCIMVRWHFHEQHALQNNF